MKNRRRRATVRREKFRACHCPDSWAGRPRGAVPPSQETDGVRNRESRKRSRTRGQPTSRARRERRLPMRFSVRVLFFLWFAGLLIALSAAPRSLAQTQAAKISGIVTDPQGSAIAGAQVSVESIPLVGSPVCARHFHERWPICFGAFTGPLSRHDCARFVRGVRTRNYDCRGRNA